MISSIFLLSKHITSADYKGHCLHCFTTKLVPAGEVVVWYATIWTVRVFKAWSWAATSKISVNHFISPPVSQSKERFLRSWCLSNWPYKGFLSLQSSSLQLHLSLLSMFSFTRFFDCTKKFRRASLLLANSVSGTKHISHTLFNANKATPAILAWPIQSDCIVFWVKKSIFYQEMPCLSIHLIQLYPCPIYQDTTEPNNFYHPGINSSYQIVSVKSGLQK